MSNYVRDTGAIIHKPTPGAPAWVRAQQQVYGPGLPGGLGFDIGSLLGELTPTTMILGAAAVGGLFWFLKKRK